MTRRVYLDHNATTPLRPAARDAMLGAFARAGNASSIHAEGRAARALIENARLELGDFLNTPAKAIVFTSGGTEALNLALTPHIGVPGAGPFDLLLIGAGEHAAAMSGHRFPAGCAETVALTAEGGLDLAALEAALARHAGRRVMLALQAANNETGVIQPVAEASRLVHAAGGFVVCDAVQAAGKIDCDAARLGADAIAVSAHKFGGPQGVGALCFASSAAYMKDAIIRGGGQERGFRAGTESVAAIAGMAAAARAARETREREQGNLALWRDRLEREISRTARDARFFGSGGARLPNTSCFAISGIEAQVLLMRLDIEGVAVSSGSACSSGKVKRSHVLMAMGVAPDLASGAIRISLGWDTSEDDCALFVEVFEKAIHALKARLRRGPGQAA